MIWREHLILLGSDIKCVTIKTVTTGGFAVTLK